MTTESTPRTGACLCGAVRFSVQPTKPRYTICHCGMCRRWSAGPLMSVNCQGDAEITDDDGALTWYRSSDWGERGFCSRCGTSLFWRLANDPGRLLAVAVDTLENADGIELSRHYFIDSRPDRYAFADDRPRLTAAQIMEEMGV